jgi:signal peptidase I
LYKAGKKKVLAIKYKEPPKPVKGEEPIKRDKNYIKEGEPNVGDDVMYPAKFDTHNILRKAKIIKITGDYFSKAGLKATVRDYEYDDVYHGSDDSNYNVHRWTFTWTNKLEKKSHVIEWRKIIKKPKPNDLKYVKLVYENHNSDSD